MTTPAMLDLFRHNTWANLEILDYCESQPADLLDASVPGTFGTTRATLMHLVAAQQGYAARLRGEPFEDSISEEDAFPGFEELRRHLRRSGESALESARALTDDAMFRVSGDEGSFAVTAGVMLTQVINHATEHRAHIMTTLSALGAEPIGLDGWEWGLDIGTMTKSE